MNEAYFYLAILLLPFSACEAPSSGSEAGASPEQLLIGLVEENRFLSVEEVAGRIINDDPSLMLVDVRTHEEYDNFSLKEAVNIPMGDFLNEESTAQLDCERYSIVFFSNSSIRAEKVWMIGRRKGCKDIYIMKGGLNEWMEKIMNPNPPPQTASAEEWETYRLHKAARKYFIGSSRELEPEPYVPPVVAAPKPKKKEIQVVPKPKKKAPVEEEEGC